MMNFQNVVVPCMFIAILTICNNQCQGWVLTSTPPSSLILSSTVPTLSSKRIFHVRQPVTLCSSTAVNSNSEALANNNDDDEDDDDKDGEYEFVEYDILTEAEFLGSEWLVGTVMDSNPNKIVETWVRLATDKDGKNVAIWGDNSQGSWNFDVASQFLSMAKENLLGKQIWAGVVDDYYYTQGTVRGWNFFSPASVLGQWQAKRLGVDKDEAGIAPWFENQDDDEEEET